MRMEQEGDVGAAFKLLEIVIRAGTVEGRE